MKRFKILLKPVVELNADPSQEEGIRLFESEGEETVIGYRAADHILFLDRRKSGNVNFNPDFASIEKVSIMSVNKKIKLRIFVDQSIIEVFANDGEATITDYVFPESSSYKIETYNKGGAPAPLFKLWKLKSVWGN